MKKAFLLSLTIHLLFIFIILFFIKKTIEVSDLQPGFQEIQKAYVVMQPYLLERKVQNKMLAQKVKLRKTIESRKGLLVKSMSQPLSTAIMQQPLPGQSALLALLHNKIQQQISLYSDELDSFNKQDLLVEFTAYPDGSLQNFKVDSSDNLGEISSAVVSILKTIPPIYELRKYLKQPQVFKLKIRIM